MTKTVLIVVSSYAPAMIADMHRARLLSWELPAHGWNVEILAPSEAYQNPEYIETDATAFFPPSVPVHYAPALNPVLDQLIRSSTIGWKALLPLNKLAASLFSQRKFDLTYFSTAKANLFLLGFWWYMRHGVPYVIDIHDPIYRERPAYFGGTGPGLKRTVNLWLLKRIEALVTSRAAGLVSVSPKYLETIEARYSHHQPQWLQKERHAVIPFAAAERDLLEVGTWLASRKSRRDAFCRVVYVGAGGAVMRKAFASLCVAIQTLVERQEMPNVPMRIELYGTMGGWREGDKKDLFEIARKCGVENIVSENPRRVSYRRSLELLLEADGALVLGVDDEGYMPSKLYTYAVSAKPLLGVFRRQSAAHNAFLAEPRLGHLLSFGGEGVVDDSGADSVKSFFAEVVAHATIDRHCIVRNYLAPAMARRHVELFDACTVARAMVD